MFSAPSENSSERFPLGWREVFVIDQMFGGLGILAAPNLRSSLFGAICTSPDLPASSLGESLVVHILKDRLGCEDVIWELSGVDFDWSNPDSFVLWACGSTGLLNDNSFPSGVIERLAQRCCCFLYSGNRAHAAIDLLALRNLYRLNPSVVSPDNTPLIERFAMQSIRYLSTSVSIIPDAEARWYVRQLTGEGLVEGSYPYADAFR